MPSSNTVKNLGGRPSIYSDDLAITICARLSEGESMRSVCRDPSMPALSTAFKWLCEKPEFSDRYERARVLSADAYAETITDVACRTLDGEYDASAARVAIDAYKWTAARLKPQKYGEKSYQYQEVSEKREIRLVLPGGELTQRLQGVVIDNKQVESISYEDSEGEVAS